jgi:nucleotide-binding universal stress UspA family protein
MPTINHNERTTTRQTTTSAVHPMKVLVVIDGAEQTGRVIEYALKLAEHGRTLNVVLLGIIRDRPDGRLRGYGSFKREEIHSHLKERMEQRAIGAAGRRFDQVGIVHKDRIEIGEPAETILRVAQEEDVSTILVGDAPSGVIERWLPKVLGLSPATTATQVARLAAVPVVVLK